MAAHPIGFVDTERPVAGPAILRVPFIQVYSVGAGASAVFRNRVWDTVLGGHVRWETPAADVAGGSYPGPGVFGAQTSAYCVESIGSSA